MLILIRIPPWVFLGRPWGYLGVLLVLFPGRFDPGRVEGVPDPPPSSSPSFKR